jgi:hypothetical protein
MRTTRRRSGALRRAVFTLVAAAVVVVVVGLVFHKGVGPLPDPEGCSATVGGTSVDLSTEQAENASIIAAVAVRRGLPARAVSIALATAFQESKLRNLAHGDRDSLGLFQQRPSMGWGTASQITDPYYAAGRFYDALQKVSGYQSMRITEAAQKVQRSAYPEAYEDHAPDGRALASALTGFSPARFTCVVRTSPFHDVKAQQAGANGLTARADAVRQEAERAFPTRTLPGSVGDGGKSFALRARGSRRGWATASYLVAQAKRLDIASVQYGDRVWSRGDASEQGWRTASSPARPGGVRVRVL